MCSLFRRDKAAWCYCVLLIAPVFGQLRVCADPNNMPFSNHDAKGFENRIADVIAHDLNIPVEYSWWSQRKNFVRNTLEAGRCDVVIGLPYGTPAALTTAPYYRSVYTMVYRADSGLHLASLQDPALNRLRIGVHITDDNLAPPAQILAKRGIVNITGFSLFGRYGDPNPPGTIIDAVGRGEIDVAIVWGPLGGYFASRSKRPLITAPLLGTSYVPLSYDISVGVRKGHDDLKRHIESVLQRERPRIRSILASYSVPLVGGG